MPAAASAGAPSGSHGGARRTSARQASLARAFARRHGVESRVHVCVGDYLETAFPDASFEVVWALESACYAPDKRLFIAEARRLLRRGGRLVVGDGFLRRSPRGSGETEDYEAFTHGLALPDVAFFLDFKWAMRELGFRAIRSWDKTVAATPSAWRLFARCLPAYPIAALGETLGLTSPLLTANVRAGIAQYRMIRAGMIGYRVLCGERE
jgi:SAM-dependent methyltransferase